MCLHLFVWVCTCITCTCVSVHVLLYVAPCVKKYVTCACMCVQVCMDASAGVHVVCNACPYIAHLNVCFSAHVRAFVCHMLVGAHVMHTHWCARLTVCHTC